jgi:hypothetical protein
VGILARLRIALAAKSCEMRQMVERIRVRLPGGATMVTEKQGKRWYTVQMSEAVRQEILYESARIDGGPSGLLNSCFRHFMNELEGPNPPDPTRVLEPVPSDRVEQRYILYESDAEEFDQLVAQTGRDPGELLEVVWDFNRERVRGLPTVNDMG